MLFGSGLLTRFWFTIGSQAKLLFGHYISATRSDFIKKRQNCERVDHGVGLMQLRRQESEKVFVNFSSRSHFKKFCKPRKASINDISSRDFGVKMTICTSERRENIFLRC